MYNNNIILMLYTGWALTLSGLLYSYLRVRVCWVAIAMRFMNRQKNEGDGKTISNANQFHEDLV
jgi:hypothetical protein